MPLYTYVMSWKGRTATRQIRKSNYTGWVSEVIRDAFPDMPKGERLFLRPEPVEGQARAWATSASIDGAELHLHVTETRD